MADYGVMYAKSMKKKKSPWLSEFGRRLKLLRGKMTTVELAKKIGVTDGAIRMWETGMRDPGVEKTSRIARALGVSLESLTNDDAAKAAKPIDLDVVADLVRAYGRAHSVRQSIMMYIATDNEEYLARAMDDTQIEERDSFEQAMIQFSEELRKADEPPAKG